MSRYSNEINISHPIQHSLIYSDELEKLTELASANAADAPKEQRYDFHLNGRLSSQEISRSGDEIARDLWGELGRLISHSAFNKTLNPYQASIAKQLYAACGVYFDCRRRDDAVVDTLYTELFLEQEQQPWGQAYDYILENSRELLLSLNNEFNKVMRI